MPDSPRLRLLAIAAAVVLAGAAGYWLTGGEPQSAWTAPPAEAAAMTADAPDRVAMAPGCEEQPRRVVIDGREVSAFATICHGENGETPMVAPPPAAAPAVLPDSEPAAQPKPRRGKGPREVFLDSSRAIRIAHRRGPAGTVHLERTWTGPAGQPCQDYEQRVTFKGRHLRSTGTVCQRKDGSWALLSDRAVKAAATR